MNCFLVFFIFKSFLFLNVDEFYNSKCSKDRGETQSIEVTQRILKGIQEQNNIDKPSHINNITLHLKKYFKN